MNMTNEKITNLAERVLSGQPIKIAIMGLGSVGNYLLDYLTSWNENLEIHVCGRATEKMEMDVNIVRVGNLIRTGAYKSTFIHSMDFEDINAISEFLELVEPDFIVNTSRVYSGLKYGSISWESLRAYGIWSPLSVHYIRNIMKAVEDVSSHAVVINTSYSDVVNPWLKSAGLQYPDFGSGNLNHLIPRIKMAIMKHHDISDLSRLEIVLATSHHHDVLISKEGQVNNLPR